MAKQFTRIEPTIVQEFGLKYKRHAVIKKFQTEDGLQHEFTTIYKEGSESAAVIALTRDNEVICVHEFRPGSEQWVYEIPGGALDAGENPETGVARELQEETGYVPGILEYLGRGYGDAYTNTVWHYFLATDCTLGEDGPALDSEEDDQGAEVKLITIRELIDNAKYTAMTDSHAVLLAYDKLKELEGARDEKDN